MAKKRNGWGGGVEREGGGSKVAEEVDLHKRETQCTMSTKPFPLHSFGQTHQDAKKKSQPAPPFRKNKSLHFLDVLVALTFACAVSPLTNVTKAHPSTGISSAEGVLAPRKRKE